MVIFFFDDFLKGGFQYNFVKGLWISHVDMAGGGGCEMSVLLHKPYLVKWSTKGGGGRGSKCPINCPHSL